MAQDFAKRFYKSIVWKKVRDVVKMKAHGICQQCGKPCNGEVHHITWLTPYNINNPAVTLSQDNLIYLCHDCHCLRHGVFGQTDTQPDRFTFDAAGNAIPQQKCKPTDNGQHTPRQIDQ